MTSETLRELDRHCRTLYSTDILGNPLHVLWASWQCSCPGSAVQAANVIRAAHGLPLVLISFKNNEDE